jgi:hypothetical protein
MIPVAIHILLRELVVSDIKVDQTFIKVKRCLQVLGVHSSIHSLDGHAQTCGMDHLEGAIQFNFEQSYFFNQLVQAWTHGRFAHRNPISGDVVGKIEDSHSTAAWTSSSWIQRRDSFKVESSFQFKENLKTIGVSYILAICY